MFAKLISATLAVALAFSLSLSPVCQVQKAEAVLPAIPVGTAAGYALATVLGIYGFQIGIADDGGAESLFDAFGNFVNDIQTESVTTFLEACGVDVASTNVWGDETTPDDVLEAIKNWGSNAKIDLNELAIDSETWFVPVALGMFVDALSGGYIEDDSAYLLGTDVSVDRFVISSSSVVPGSDYDNEGAYFVFQYGGYNYVSNNSLVDLPVTVELRPNTDGLYGDGDFYLAFQNDVFHRYEDGLHAVSPNSFITGHSINESKVTSLFNSTDEFSFTLGSNTTLRLIDYRFGAIAATSYLLYDPAFGWDPDILSGNPDVNLGRDFYEDAQAIRDGKAFVKQTALGHDLVIDRDYISDRGSVSVPLEGASYDSWADVLNNTLTGLADAVNEGLISISAAITAVDVLTKELVTDTVGKVNKPTQDTSVSKPRTLKNMTTLFRQIFPFCLAFDLTAVLALFQAEPEAPYFEFPIANGFTDETETLVIDLSEWEPAAATFRTCFLVLFGAGLILLTLRFVGLAGSDSSSGWGGKKGGDL